ncbi:MAG: hypothetical protein JWQ66_1687 [Mucilaginibacter sp.]|nr:hypothetical protein [Mucilaginibacter sp.]
MALRFKLLMFSFVVLTNSMSFAQGGNLILSARIEALQRYAATHPTEKVHLHLDRPWYGLSDTIWFKAYTVSGEFHLPSRVSGVIYAELINDKDSLLSRRIIPLNQGTGSGDFIIPDTYKSGVYRLRAYTSWMRNDSDYFYDQPIIIGGLQLQIMTPKPYISNPHANNTAQTKSFKPDVQFFPEGGDLVAGMRSRVAFKALNTEGAAASIAGVITDQDGIVLATLNTQHAGMGQFQLTPVAGRHYIAKILCADGTGYAVDLPEAKDAGFTLSINNSSNDSLYVKVAANEALYRNRQDTSFYLIAQSGGRYYFAASGKLVNRVFTTQIAKTRFPSGIVQFTLFSQSGEPLNERVVFVQNNDQLKLNLSTGKPSYAPNENVMMALVAENKAGGAVTGRFSASVTDETQVPVDEPAETTIFTDLLLASELKGHIENPNYYFADENDKTRSDLDLLMLTQGYRRFEWKKILDQNNAGPAFKPETSLSLSGTVTTPGNKPVSNAKVRLTSIKNYFAADTLTDAKGNFTFANLNFVDTTKVIVNAKKAKGGDDVEVLVKKPLYPEINKMAVYGNYADSVFSAPVKEALAKTYITGRQDHMKNVIHLKQVDIKERKRNPIFEPVYSDNMKLSSNLNGPGNADQVILSDVIMRGGGGELSEILVGKVDHVNFSGGLAYLGSPKKPMAIFVEGAQVSPNMLDNINPDDIYSIEVLRHGGYLAIYGSNAPHGALIITLKHGSSSKAAAGSVASLVTYNFAGFHKARQFYSPKYTEEKSAQTTDDRKTVYWKPDIITDANGKASFSFFNASNPGTYRVVIEGIDGDGNIGRQVYRYKVE